MHMEIRFVEPGIPSEGALFVGAGLSGEEGIFTLSATATALDQQCQGVLTRALSVKQFKGKQSDLFSVIAPAGISVDQIILVGTGKGSEITLLQAERIGGRIAAYCRTHGISHVQISIDLPEDSTLKEQSVWVAGLANGIRLRSYRFEVYKTRDCDSEGTPHKPKLETVILTCSDPAAVHEIWKRLSAVSDGVLLARDLVSEPANILSPYNYAERCRALEDDGISVEILDEAAMQKLGMGALLGVGRGSAQESQMVVMRWNGGPVEMAPLGFVGKGVTFDTGGISLKPAAGMEDMKWDMGGSAAVVGLMKALARRGAKVNVVGIVGLVENMPGGKAQRPGDIVTSLSGQTIEILNTDAEGRLVLADALWYMQDHFQPQFIIDLATLTGAIIISLGHEKAGLFANNDKLAKQLEMAGAAVGESVWRFPLAKEYDKELNSDIADMRNIGGGRGAGSIVAAQFLQRFVKDKQPWAHLDIAGMAWGKKDRPLVPKGAVGFGVRLLDRLVADYFEE